MFGEQRTLFGERVIDTRAAVSNAYWVSVSVVLAIS